MAGDWIKFEHATLDKPEVLRMAEMLGISRREMLGLLLDFFCWLDKNSRHGCVTHMSRMSLDSVTHTSGFSACLVDVGWAEIDDATGVLTIKNWDRHNGNTAKTRALGRDRKVTQRSRTQRDEIVTREEKRREEELNPPNPPAEKPPPNGFQRFWLAYPTRSGRRKNRKSCLTLWQRRGFEQQADAIVAHVEAMKASHWRPNGSGDSYEPGSDVYLRNERWLDGESAPEQPARLRVAI